LIAFSSSIFSQGKRSEKSKQKNKKEVIENTKAKKDNIDKKERDIYSGKVWEGTNDKDGGGPKYSKNQPAKVRQSFQRDYPNAINVYWTKYRGDWTATFGNGLFRSTAVYHANGDRRDTRTLVLRDKIPRSIIDIILKRRPEAKVDDAIRIEIPKTIKEIFRIKNIIDGKPAFEYYNTDGLQVQYDY
jgi:hypothetical protein